MKKFNYILSIMSPQFLQTLLHNTTKKNKRRQNKQQKQQKATQNFNKKCGHNQDANS